MSLFTISRTLNATAYGFLHRSNPNLYLKISQPTQFMHTSKPIQGWMATVRYITLNCRSRGQRKWYKRFKSNNKQWKSMKWLLNELVLKQRLHLTRPWSKELQQYAEELIYLAKTNNPHNNGMVESIITSSAAREILYEKLVPRYKDRPFYFTRLVNKWQYRDRDSAPMGIIEFVDRPGEYEPATPVGDEKKAYIKSVMEYGSRRTRRRLLPEAFNMGIIPEIKCSNRVITQRSQSSISQGQKLSDSLNNKAYNEKKSRIAIDNRKKQESAGPKNGGITSGYVMSKDFTLEQYSPVGIKPSMVIDAIGEKKQKSNERRSVFQKYLNERRGKTFEELNYDKKRFDRRVERRKQRATGGTSDSNSSKFSNSKSISSSNTNSISEINMQNVIGSETSLHSEQAGSESEGNRMSQSNTM